MQNYAKEVKRLRESTSSVLLVVNLAMVKTYVLDSELVDIAEGYSIYPGAPVIHPRDTYRY